MTATLAAVAIGLNIISIFLFSAAREQFSSDGVFTPKIFLGFIVVFALSHFVSYLAWSQ